MKTIKDRIIYFTFEGKVDERHNRLLIQEIIEMKEAINSRKLSGLFISFQNVTYDLNSLKKLLLELQKIQSSINTPICLGEFTTILYNILKKETQNTYIKLFKTFGLAQLFLNTKYFKKKLKVLMFDDGENEEELDIQASLLTKYDHNILYTKDTKEFTQKITDPDVDFAVSQTKINLQKKEETAPAVKMALSKQLISNLSLFIDTAAENLEILTKLKAKKTSHTISTFNKDIDANIISAVMQFKGAIEGKFILIFPREIAVLSIEAMLGEKINENDTEAICDGIGEFCNIIMGSVKTKLSKTDTKVLFELPRTFTSIAAITNTLSQNSGIWINMELSNKPFYMYIIK